MVLNTKKDKSSFLMYSQKWTSRQSCINEVSHHPPQDSKNKYFIERHQKQSQRRVVEILKYISRTRLDFLGITSYTHEAIIWH